MRNFLTAMFALSAMVFLGTSAANASVTQIFLGGSTSGTLTFASGSPSTTVAVTLKDVTGPAATSPSTNPFTYTLAGGSAVDVTLTAAGSGYYTASNTPISVFITDGSGDTLTGTMTMVDLQQEASDGLVNFFPTITANLIVTGATGSLAGFQSAGSAQAPLVLALASLTAINDLGGSESESVASALILPSPEPRTMLLFGSGLVLLGGFLRRRLLS